MKWSCGSAVGTIFPEHVPHEICDDGDGGGRQVHDMCAMRLNGNYYSVDVRWLG